MTPEAHLDHLEFLNAVWSRRTPFTWFFLGANIAVFILMAFAGGSTNETVLVAFGMKSNAEIAQGQTWRFVTPIFIHIGLLHLFFNSYALWMVGPQVEKLYGSARFVLLYLATGIAGVAASYFYHPSVKSAGASGAIFGLFGVLLVFGVRHRDSVPEFFRTAVGTSVLPVIVINLIIGFTIPGIDNSAHIGGLLCGAALAAVVPFQRPGEDTSRGFKTVQVVLLALVAISFYEVAVNYNGPRLSVRNLTAGFTGGGTSSSVQDFIDTINTAQKTFEASTAALESGRAGDLAKTRTDLTKSIDQLQKIPSLSAKADPLTADLLRVMQDQYDLMQDIDRAGTTTLAHSLRLKEITLRYENAVDALNDWVKNEGQKYGIQMGKSR